MFTGIIEGVGRVKSSSARAGGLLVRIDLGGLCDGLKAGDSIAVNGVCLTAAKIERTSVEFDISAETVTKSSLGSIKAGEVVNIERAMSADGRFGGHIVQGHVDGVARVKSIDRKGDFFDIRFAADSSLLDCMVLKGSVAVDGISLTVAELSDRSFGVTVIPTTWESTTFSGAKVGDVVNVETDVFVKVIRSQLEKILPTSEGLSAEKLKELGF